MQNGLIYQATNVYGESFTHYDRDMVFEWYESSQGVKLISKTKDLFPTINVIADKHIDVNNLREDDILNKTTIAMRKAISKYDEKNTKQVKLKLNINYDQDILDYLSQLENVQGFLKDIIRKEIKNVAK